MSVWFEGANVKSPHLQPAGSASTCVRKKRHQSPSSHCFSSLSWVLSCKTKTRSHRNPGTSTSPLPSAPGHPELSCNDIFHLLSPNKKWRRKNKKKDVGLLSRADGVSGTDARHEEGTPQLPSAVIVSSRTSRLQEQGQGERPLGLQLGGGRSVVPGPHDCIPRCS
jgi:hypothetical protein